jgi:hypothetical protein
MFFFVSFVFFVDDMQCWLLNNSLHAIALGQYAAHRALSAVLPGFTAPSS